MLFMIQENRGHRLGLIYNIETISIWRILTLAFAGWAAGLIPANAQPNILIIVADDLGYSDLGCYGGEIDTPNLDRLAKDGVRLTQFYNTGRCCPSRTSILSGQYPHTVGVGHMVNDLNLPGYRGRISENAQTIAEILKPANYRSFIAGKWHLGTDDPTQHGFEEFYGSLKSCAAFFDPDYLLRMPQNRTTREYPNDGYYATDAITDYALDFLNLARETPNQPWFLYLAHPAPHFPLQAPEEEIKKYADRYNGGWDELRSERLARLKEMGIVDQSTDLPPRSPYWNFGETVKGLNPAWNSIEDEDRKADLARRMAIYAAMIDRMDQQIGRVFNDLKEHDEYNNTLIIFLSDNGACGQWGWEGFDTEFSNNNILHTADQLHSMGRPGSYHSVGSGWANASNTPWRMYKQYNHEGGINAPAIVHWPSRLKSKAGTLHHQPAHVIDLMATAVTASGTSYEGTLPLAGKDLVQQITNESSDTRTLYFEHEGHRAVREGKWKLVAIKYQPWELYDMSAVRTETKDLSNSHPDIVASLSRKWDSWADKNNVTPLPADYKVKYLKTKGAGS